jgi:hypothetical protein
VKTKYFKADPGYQQSFFSLKSDGGFAKLYPRFLGTWRRGGEWEENPFYTCIDCQGLRAFVVNSKVKQLK